ncbi:MAG: tetratricopeptide repeat protein, partial [Candidatus Poribacteria bacterium]|nr:tetratricopeptide repeat protein [Candidatus Poribacteria bacterium]
MNGKSAIQENFGGVLEKIREIVEKSADADYIYRGEPECYPKISSGLYRPFADFVIEHPDFAPFKPDVASMEAAILQAAREYLYELGSDFEILAELQHYGCKTNLIDFTTDYLIALFFASTSSYHKDGRVILLKRVSENYQIEAPSQAIKRVESQKSVLVRSLKGFVDPDDIVVIPKDLKLSVLNYLQKYHDISTKHIYKDIHGFIKWLGTYLDPNLEFARGVIYQNRGDLASEMQEKQNWYEKAIVHYTETLKLESGCIEAYNNRGVVYRDKGEFDRALQDFNTAIDLDPDYASAYNNRGIVYGKNGKPDSALQDFNTAIDLDPESVDSYNNRGLTYKEIGEVDLAIEDYNKAIQLDPKFPKAYNNRGVVYDERGELDNAIRDYSKAIELNPDYENAYNNRGMAYGDKGDVNRAISDFSIAVKLKSDYASAYNNLGVEYRKKNQLDNALQNCSKAIELNPDYAEAYSNRGAAYFNKGEYDKGIRDFNKAIELNPDYAEAYSNRGAA